MPALATKSYEKAYETGVLKEEVHHRLVADIGNIARDAAIQPHWIWTPLAQVVECTDAVDWVRRFNYFRYSDEASGLCLHGKAHVKMDDWMAAIAGALVRNFIRARVMTLGQIFDHLEDKDLPSPTCLLIPNFFTGATMGAALPAWKASMLLDMLLERRLNGQQTVIYVPEWKALSAEYGIAMAKFIMDNYCKIQI